MMRLRRHARPQRTLPTQFVDPWPATGAGSCRHPRPGTFSVGRGPSRERQHVARLAFTAVLTLTSLVSSAAALDAQSRAGGSPSDTLHLTLPEARVRAIRANPDLQAARLDTAVARGQLRQARVIRFNPSADIVARPSGEELEASVSQEIEIFGQRGTRIAVGRAGLEGADAGVTNAMRVVVGQVDRTFYQLASAAQRSKLSDEVLALNTRLADVAGRQLREGEISRLDYNLAVVELGRARARALATRREQQRAGIELVRLLGMPRGTAVAAVPDSVPVVAADTGHVLPKPLVPSMDTSHVLDVDALTEHALRRRPDLMERAAALRQTRAQLSLARREALPNPVVRGVVEQPTTGGPRTLRPGIGLTLPFLNRNQGERQALRAAARQAELEQAALTATVRAEIASAVASYESAASEVAVLQATVLAPARQNRQLVEVAYREGKVGLPVLLLIQNQAIDAELDFWSSWLAAREALATLAEATAQNIEGLPATDPRTQR